MNNPYGYGGPQRMQGASRGMGGAPMQSRNPIYSQIAQLMSQPRMSTGMQAPQMQQPAQNFGMVGLGRQPTPGTSY